MKSNIKSIAILLAIILSAVSLQSQQIIGYSGLFTFDTRISGVNGVVTNASTGTGISGATITLTGSSQNFSATSLSNGGYSISGVPGGNYNLSFIKPGYQSYNINITVTGGSSQTVNAALSPNNNTSLSINAQLTAYANQIIESPANKFTLTGSVSINNVLYFDNSIVIDKRSSLANPEVSGSCNFFAKNIGNQQTYWIKQNTKTFKYYADENRLIPLSKNYLIATAFKIGGFNTTLGELILDEDEDFVEVKSIAELPFPLNKVLEELSKEFPNNIPLLVSKMAASHILSKQNGVQTAVDIDEINVNIGIVSLEDVHLYFNTNTQTYGGGFKLNIPGTTQNNKTEYLADSLDPAFNELSVEIRNEDQEVVDSLSFNEFIDFYKSSGFHLLSVGAEIEFTYGKINKIIVSIGTKVPIGPTGLFLTEITGGLEDLATSQWKVIANVDIELGFEVPLLGSPVKFDDFGVTIQPWEVFKGSGEFQIFEQPVSDGLIEYNRPKRSLSGQCNLNLAGILKGKTMLNLVGGQVNGSGLLTIQTPPDLPLLLNWAENKRIGAALAELNNQYFQSQVELGWISLAQKLEFARSTNPLFPWCHFYIGRNLGNLSQIWKGKRNGKQAILFQVPENTNQILVVAMDTLNPTSFNFTLQSPSGQLFDGSNAHHYELNEAHHQTIMSLMQPVEGDWYFLSDYEGDVTLHISATNQIPTTLVNNPSSRKTRSNLVSVSLTDYADTLNVQAYYDDDRNNFNGTLIDEFSIVNNGNLEFVWQNDELANGEYYIYYRIDDGSNAPFLQYAPGSVWIENDVNIEIPQNFSAIQEADSIAVSWNSPGLDNTIATTVYFKNISNGRTDQETVYDSTSLALKDLKYGQAYEMWACFINENGTFSQPSNKINLVYVNNSRNNPPYFTLDPDSSFVFVVGEATQYTLTANDVDGNELVFNIPNDTLGIVLSGDKINWTPSDEQKGVYQLMITVSDGSSIDTTYQQMIVYTQQQLAIDLTFSSINLYENDNMFIKLRNFKCAENIQQVSIKNKRTLVETIVECRKVDDFEYIGQFDLSFEKRTEINVINGDTILASYSWDNQMHTGQAYYDSLPQPTDQTPPGQINDLSAERQPNNQIELSWTASGNDAFSGKAYRYDIRYAFEPILTEGDFFTANLIPDGPYPSVAGQQDSLIINLIDLNEISLHNTIYFSIKAEDEMQNRGDLSNSLGIGCLVNPSDVNASIQDIYNIDINWNGPLPAAGKDSGLESYNLFREINDGGLILFQTDLAALNYQDQLKNMPDGSYRYGIQAVYTAGASDTILSQAIVMDRFVNVNILCQLAGQTDFSGINLNMTALDTVYGHTFVRETNLTGLVMLSNVYHSLYRVEITKEGWTTVIDTIQISAQLNSFNFSLDCQPIAPSNITIVNITYSTAEVEWQANGSLGEWDLLSGPLGFDPMSEGTLLTGINEQPVELINLSPSTQYAVYLRAVCGGVEATDWVGPATFETMGILTIEATAGSGGSIEPSGMIQVAYNSDHTFVITPDEGYEIADVLVDGVSASAVVSYTFSDIITNHTIEASFIEAPFIVTTSANPAAGGTTSGGGTYQNGQSCTIAASANIGYNFTNWTEAGNVVSSNPNYTFSVAGSRTLIANFLKIEYTVTATAGSGGTVAPAMQMKNYQDAVSATATPIAGYTFNGWQATGVTLANTMANPASFTMPANNVVLHALFIANPYTVSLVANPSNGGAFSAVNPTYTVGQAVSVTATPAAGYAFINFTATGITLANPTNVSQSFTMPAGNVVLTANFQASNSKLIGQVKCFNQFESTLPITANLMVGLYNGTTLISSQPVIVKQPGNIGGYYEFPGIVNGTNYTVRVWEAGTTVGDTYTWNNWDGVNAVDALIISYMAIEHSVVGNFPWIAPVFVPNYTPFAVKVADVNSNGYVSAVDALLLAYRSVGYVGYSPFPNNTPNFMVAGAEASFLGALTYPAAPGIIFAKNGTYAAATIASDLYYSASVIGKSGETVFNIYYIPAGDINASHVPQSSSKAAINLNYTGQINAQIGDEVRIPIRMDQSIQLGAMNLGLSFNNSLIQVLDVEDYEIKNIDNAQGTVRIAWMDCNAKNVNANDNIVVISAKVLASIEATTRVFEIESSTEFANADAITIDNLSLTTSSIQTGNPTSIYEAAELSFTTYPNPFDNEATISYQLPVSGKVSIVVYDKLGQEVRRLVNVNQVAGQHTVKINSSDLNGTGAYFFKIYVEGSFKSYNANGTLIFVK